METPTPTYAEAMERLQTLVEELENGDLDIDTMMAHVQEAEGLVTLCRARLRDVSTSLDDLLERMKNR